MIIEKAKNVINYLTKNKKKEKEIPVFKNYLLVQDLDKFFKEIYSYYYLGGYKYIKIQILLDIIIYLFTTHFIMFIFFFIDWEQLFNINQKNILFPYSQKNISSNITSNLTSNITSNLTAKIVENITKLNVNSTINTIINNNYTVDEFYELKNYISLSLFYRHKFIAIGFYFLLMHYLIAYFYSSLVFLFRMKFIREIYKNKFYLHTKDLERISFNNIINLVIDLQNKENYCRVKDNLTKFDIISRICRKDNYITALTTFGLLNFNIFGINLMTNFIFHKLKGNFMTILFPENEAEINRRFYNKRFFKLSMIIQICFQIIKIPPEIILRITFFFIKRVDKFKSNEITFKNRWDRTNLTFFKNYNELKHHFRKRISKSYSPTNKFLLCFENKKISILFHTLKLIGIYSILFFLMIVIFTGSNITHIRINNIKFTTILLVLLITLGLINYLGCGEGSSANTIENFDEKNKNFKELIKYIENIPTDWEVHKICKNYKFINNSYKNNIYHFLIELLSVLFQPIIWIKIIKNYNEISSFIRTFSIDINGIGTVCSLSVLNLKEYIKNQEQINNLYQNSTLIRYSYAKFLNSIIYFEKYFSIKDASLDHELNDNKNKKSDKNNEAIVTDEEILHLKNNEEIKEYDTKENDVKFINIITEKIFENYKGKINNSEINENINYYINIGNNIDFNEIIKNFYDKKGGFISV